MADYYLTAFLVLLLVYGGYSFYVRLDPRYPIAAGLLLLVLTALLSASGAVDSAATAADYAFLLLAAGVVLLLADRARDRWGHVLGRGGGPEPTAQGREPTDQGDRPS